MDSVDTQLKLISEIGSDDIRSIEELKQLLEEKKEPGPVMQAQGPVAYIGFEPSSEKGMHIAQGFMTVRNINLLLQCGFRVKVWIADWFAYMNNKLGGDLAKIREAGGHMIRLWKACGLTSDRVEFIWASDEILKRGLEYWPIVMDIARKNSILHMTRCTGILGRRAEDRCPECNEPSYEGRLTSDFMYACMQAADPIFLGVDLCFCGNDQVKVYQVTREYVDSLSNDPFPVTKTIPRKPIIVSHHLLMGLLEGEEKMSKSTPGSAIFMEDDPNTVKRKIKSAYCKPGDITTNPLLDWLQYMIFPYLNGRPFVVTRPPKYGGDSVYLTFTQLQEDFKTERLHPGDLKPAVAAMINEMLEPIAARAFKVQ